MKMYMAAALATIVAVACVGGTVIKNRDAEDLIDPTESTQIAEDVKDDETEILLGEMTLEEKVCQMMFVTPESITGVGTAVRAGEQTKEALEKYPVGGIIYFAKNIKDREQLVTMIENSQKYAKIPLFVGVDEEGGRVSRVASNPEMKTTRFGAMKNVENSDEAYIVGQTLGRELGELGFNVDFAPVADVIIDEENSEIGDRSFGSDNKRVADCVEAVVCGLEENNVSSVLKHFPGHGSTRANSHKGYSSSERTLEELRSCEFVPFKKGIDAGCDFVMVSHMTLVNCDTDGKPCSLSEKVIDGWLKKELGFDGIAITDSLSMGAVTEKYTAGEAAVLAVKAGNDMLLMPQNPEEANTAVCEAVRKGEIPESRIDESVGKILRLKANKKMTKEK